MNSTFSFLTQFGSGKISSMSAMSGANFFKDLIFSVPSILYGVVKDVTWVVARPLVVLSSFDLLSESIKDSVRGGGLITGWSASISCTLTLMFTFACFRPLLGHQLVLDLYQNIYLIDACLQLPGLIGCRLYEYPLCTTGIGFVIQFVACWCSNRILSYDDTLLGESI